MLLHVNMKLFLILKRMRRLGVNENMLLRERFTLVNVKLKIY